MSKILKISIFIRWKKNNKILFSLYTKSKANKSIPFESLFSFQYTDFNTYMLYAICISPVIFARCYRWIKVNPINISSTRHSDAENFYRFNFWWRVNVNNEEGIINLCVYAIHLHTWIAYKWAFQFLFHFSSFPFLHIRTYFLPQSVPMNVKFISLFFHANFLLIFFFLDHEYFPGSILFHLFFCPPPIAHVSKKKKMLMISRS